MPRTTTYTVQTLSLVGPRKKLQADQPMQFKDRDQALRRAERAMDSKAGVFVTEVTGDAEFDDFDEPIVIYKAGRLPRGMAEEE